MFVAGMATRPSSDPWGSSIGLPEIWGNSCFPDTKTVPPSSPSPSCLELRCSAYNWRQKPHIVKWKNKRILGCGWNFWPAFSSTNIQLPEFLLCEKSKYLKSVCHSSLSHCFIPHWYSDFILTWKGTDLVFYYQENAHLCPWLIVYNINELSL